MVSVRECSTISLFRYSEKENLYYFSIEKIREFNEMSRKENAVLFLACENARIQRDVSIRECFAIYSLRKSEISTRCLSKKMLFSFSIENSEISTSCLGKRMLYYFSIKKICESNEIPRLENALLFLN